MRHLIDTWSVIYPTPSGSGIRDGAQERLSEGVTRRTSFAQVVPNAQRYTFNACMLRSKPEASLEAIRRTPCGLCRPVGASTGRDLSRFFRGSGISTGRRSRDINIRYAVSTSTLNPKP